ncbi:diacylglyceryl transferase [Christiangramia fulva]|uniref:Diacylglyceryl transferase n=1 Tax=Christiangramia fulva TaxID=2126553 RepID=A0A2R3Z8B4_9FLAO|nr:DUF6787 family protein [Christiangramia fulva]AVR46442.1 diacylglyceryl transferase [Christiangramia fulva]
MKKLKKRWGVKSNWQLFVIFLVFAITGSSAAKLASPLTNLIGINPQDHHWLIYWPIRILIILPIYQVLLLFFGWIFGQFSFFWNFEKKMLARMGIFKLLDI